LSAKLLGRVASAESTAVDRAADDRWRVAEEQVRKDAARLSDEERWSVESIYHLQTGQASLEVKEVAEHLGIPWGELEHWLQKPSNRVALMRATPSMEIELRLRMRRGRNPQHRTHRNDLKDLLFLSSVLPYADIVVTEKSWAHVLVADGLDVQYSATICRGLAELLVELKHMSG
jgi:hypothetical protein